MFHLFIMVEIEMQRFVEETVDLKSVGKGWEDAEDGSHLGGVTSLPLDFAPVPEV